MHFCTRCQLNIEAIEWTTNERHEEEYPICPQCRGAMDIIEIDKPRIVPPQPSPPPPPPVKQQKVVKRFMTGEEIREAQQREDEALTAYHRLCDTDRQQAEQVYKQIMSKK